MFPNKHPDHLAVQKDIMGSSELQLCSSVAACVICVALRLEFEANKKPEYQALLNAMSDCGTFVNTYEGYDQILPRLKNAKDAIVYRRSGLLAFRTLLQIHSPNRKYHISTNSLKFFKYISIRDDLLSEQLLKLTMNLQSGGIMDKNEENEDIQDLNDMKNSVAEDMMKVANNSDQKSDVYMQSGNHYSKLTLKHFQRLLWVSIIPIGVIIVVFIFESVRLFLGVHIIICFFLFRMSIMELEVLTLV